MGSYEITAVRQGKCVVIVRENALLAFRAALRLRELGWEVVVSR
jgi:hypothetical protein